MAEYIEREAVIRELRDVYEREFPTADGAFDLFANRIVPRVIKNIPAAEVEQVRHGQWEGTADGYADGELVYDMWNCSECGFDADGAEEKPEWKFCPNCGAWMDGGADNGETAD